MPSRKKGWESLLYVNSICWINYNLTHKQASADDGALSNKYMNQTCNVCVCTITTITTTITTYQKTVKYTNDISNPATENMVITSEIRKLTTTVEHIFMPTKQGTNNHNSLLLLTTSSTWIKQYNSWSRYQNGSNRKRQRETTELN